MSFDLTGRMAIITGANQGLGREIAAHYVAAGASVLLMARGERKLAQVTAELAKKTVAPGQKVVSFVGDVSSRAACDAAAAGAIELLGGVIGHWLLIPSDGPDFEGEALHACELLLRRDPRLGRIPKSRR